MDEVSEGGEVIGIEGSHSLGEKAVEQSGGVGSDAPICLPDGKSWKRLWEGWVGSFTILVALLEHCARKMSRMEGRGAPMIFAAVFAVVGQQREEQRAEHTALWGTCAQCGSAQGVVADTD